MTNLSKHLLESEVSSITIGLTFVSINTYSVSVPAMNSVVRFGTAVEISQNNAVGLEIDSFVQQYDGLPLLASTCGDRIVSLDISDRHLELRFARGVSITAKWQPDEEGCVQIDSAGGPEDDAAAIMLTLPDDIGQVQQ
ncbi:MAG TPA: hypothetical protein VEZ20_13105 [Allosphingosinicella sp.]|jgi:hypothetical protein|nr:hypothetical protein [Allosphingosinicella sp.]